MSESSSLVVLARLSFDDEAAAAARATSFSTLGSSEADRWSYRIVDLAVALASIMFLLPLMLLVALAVKCDSSGPIIFRHSRIGRGGKRFDCLKFRTMQTDGDQRFREVLASCPVTRAEWERSFKLRRDPRVTRLGGLLRKLSLDELPQLINVLRGEMSIVGPRPIVEAEVGRYGRFFADYCSVKPGLTGLWQISGRSETCYSERVELDARYARSKSLKNDLKILLKTVPAVLSGNGSY